MYTNIWSNVRSLPGFSHFRVLWQYICFRFAFFRNCVVFGFQLQDKSLCTICSFLSQTVFVVVQIRCMEFFKAIFWRKFGSVKILEVFGKNVVSSIVQQHRRYSILVCKLIDINDGPFLKSCKLSLQHIITRFLDISSECMNGQ